ncbi:hypothetical protein Sjap_023971 [Stephania japonica]|uniref:Uncharacterized protein n=1 Tax=Stephania japonica TaxID=461633 RepID=A0AAP0HL23_9MAGN
MKPTYKFKIKPGFYICVGDVRHTLSKFNDEKPKSTQLVNLRERAMLYNWRRKCYNYILKHMSVRLHALEVRKHTTRSIEWKANKECWVGESQKAVEGIDFSRDWGDLCYSSEGFHLPNNFGWQGRRDGMVEKRGRGELGLNVKSKCLSSKYGKFFNKDKSGIISGQISSNWSAIECTLLDKGGWRHGPEFMNWHGPEVGINLVMAGRGLEAWA